MDSISITGFAWRIVFALALVFATFNPSGFSYFHWVSGTFPSFTPAQVVLGIALLILWIFLWRSMMQAIGKIGLVLMAAFTAALVWLFVSWGWLDLRQRDDPDVGRSRRARPDPRRRHVLGDRPQANSPGRPRWTRSTTTPDQLRFERIFSARAWISVESASPRISLASRTYPRTASAASGLLIR